MGNMNLPNLKELLYFKESLSVLLISILFILLAANINVSDMELIYNWNTAILFLVIVFIIRPIGVFLSTRGSGLKLNEKLFIGWVGPRGIVAAGIASLFGSKLMAKGEVGAEYITPPCLYDRAGHSIVKCYYSQALCEMGRRFSGSLGRDPYHWSR
jgi:NhaP-type Na+/H+ or K+/H+ antiporter